MTTNHPYSAIPERYIHVEAIPDPETGPVEHERALQIAAELQQGEPVTALRTPDFWVNAGNLAGALQEKIDLVHLDDGIAIDHGTISLHAVDPRNPRVYLPNTDASLPTLKFPVTWNEASPGSRHYLSIRFEVEN